MMEKVEEVVLPEVQQSEISDLLDGLMPAQGEQVTSTEEVIVDGNEGKERSEEKAGEQVEGVGTSEEGKAEEVVVESKPEDKASTPVEGEKPTTAQEPPATPIVEETEIDRLKRENTEFRQHMEELAAQAMQAKQPKQPTPEEQKARTDAAARQVLTFLKDDDTFDEVMKSSANFNALLTSVVNTAVAKTVQLLPNITNQYVDSQLTTRLAVKDFYTDNADLLPHRQYVGFVSNELFAKNPNQSLEENFREVEKEVRARLKIARPTGAGTGEVGQTMSNRTAPSNPGFVPSGGGGGRRGSVSTDRLSAEEKGIVDLIS
jgi:hypothetical protein